MTDRTTRKMRTLLNLGMMDEFTRFALRQALRWSGPWATEGEAMIGFAKKLKHASSGSVCWLEKYADGWWMMGRLINCEPMPDWREFIKRKP